MLIFGIGGVGSALTIALVRSGVRKLTIVDFDRITISSLNRNAFATREEVGVSKVLAMKEHCEKIFPDV